jgi:hypothetical protein
MFSKGRKSVDFSVFRNNIDDLNLLNKYMGINKVPVLICSPLRQDRNPSFALFYDSNGKIRYKDFATGETGNVFDMLCKAWNVSYMDMMRTLINDDWTSAMMSQDAPKRQRRNSDTMIEVKVRRWLKHDMDYWKSYGISKKFLDFAEVYPISHIFFIKDDKTDVIDADKNAYVYVERRNGVVYKKIYQPLCKNKRYKWFSKMNGGIISLWDKIPETGDLLAICSSLKDALCLWENTGIPSIALQGEGYSMNNDVSDMLKERYKDVVVIFDNDKAGIEDGEKLSSQTGFTNIVLPKFDWGKDVSDYYKGLEDKSEFKKNITDLIEVSLKNNLKTQNHEKDFDYFQPEQHQKDD